MVEQVSLPPIEVSDPGPDQVSVPTQSNNTQPLPEDIAQQRADKTELGGLLPSIQKTNQDLKNSLILGEENYIRRTAAAAVDLKREQDKQKALIDYTKRYGQLSSIQVSKFLDPFAPQNAPTDPDTVIEDQYAKSYIGQLATAPNFLGHANLWDTAAAAMPKQTDEAMETGSDLIWKNQYLLKRLQDASILANKQSYTDWGLDLLKSLTQIYPEYKQRNLIKGSELTHLGLGNDLQEQSINLYRKPRKEFKEAVDYAYDYLSKDNPALAVSFLKSMQGQDDVQRTIDNVFTFMTIPDITMAGKLAKSVLTYNQIRKAAKDMVEASVKDANPSKENMVAAAGDVAEGAVLTVSKGVVQAIEGSANPIESARQTMLTTWKEMAENYSANTGTNLTREVNTRLQDSFVKDGTDLLNRITSMNRVERTPIAITSDDVIRAQKDKIRNDLKGPNATVIDVDGPFIEPASNTKWFRVRRGDYDGTLFSDSATAEGRVVSEGFGAVRGKSPEIVYLSPTVAKNIESIKTVKGETRFYTTGDIPVKASLAAEPGAIPYNLKTNKFEKALTEQSVGVEQQGLGFYIEHWVPMKETDNFLRDSMIRDSKGNLIPETVSHSSASGTKSIINSVLGWVRSSEETLSVNESIQRKAVVYAQNNIIKWAQELNKPIEATKNKAAFWKPTAWLGNVTGRDIKSQFERALDNARQTESWFKNPGELDDFYQRSFHRQPSELETKAYFNYVKLIEGDRMLGEIAEFRNRARVGAEQHRLRLLGPDGVPFFSNAFDGVVLKKLPSNTDQILIVGSDGEKNTVKESGAIKGKSRRNIEDAVNRGEIKLLEVYDMDHYPLKDVTNDRIRYVLAKNVETKPLEFNHVNKKEGGHFDWDYDHYIKQADMHHQGSGKAIYVGDKTIMPVGNKALGQNIIKLWNEAQELIQVGKWEEVRPIAAKLGIKYEDFTGWYKAGRDQLGKPVGPKLDAREPVYVVPKNKNINSIDDSLQLRYRFKDRNGNIVNKFEDGTRSGLANNFKVAYNTERNTDFNFRTINDIGSKENPLYAYQPANLVDPLATMNRALNRAINSTFSDDYKIYAIEHWLREAEHWLDVDGGVDAVRSAPFWHYNNPKFKASTPKDVQWNLTSHKYKIDSFVGIPNKFDTWVHTFTEHLISSAYEKYGPEATRSGYEKAKTLLPIWLLQHTKNPVDFIRGATFNFKLGLFNPAQFLVQAQTHALIWSLEPQHGTAGTYAMLLHGWSRVNKNPAILNALDNYATKLSGFGSRFRPGEFLEAMNELEKSGFEHVAGEYGNLSKAYTPTTNFLAGDITKGLKIGQTPFRLGEQSTRVTAWYTAFRKFREANPTTAITNIERGKILNEADMLTVNMSRASSSIINHGVFSLSTQFLNYQIKLAELFWSKRIDNMARARILTGFGVLYGFPTIAGVTGLPVSDNIRSALIDDLGYVPGEKWLSTMVNEGWPSWMYAMITGKGDFHKGDIENFGDRFSSQGMTQVKQALRSDIPWWQALGGAAVSTSANFIAASVDPFYQYASSWLRSDPPSERYQIHADDLLKPWKEVSVVNQTTKWIAAINTGKWLDKNERYVADVSPLRATILATLGLNPQAQDDAFIKNKLIKGEEEAHKQAFKLFQTDWGRAIEAFRNGDPEQGDSYVRNAIARFKAVGYPDEDIPAAMAMGTQGWQSSIDATDHRFWTGGDQTKRQQRFDLQVRQNELNRKRNE